MGGGGHWFGALYYRVNIDLLVDFFPTPPALTLDPHPTCADRQTCHHIACPDLTCLPPPPLPDLQVPTQTLLQFPTLCWTWLNWNDLGLDKDIPHACADHPDIDRLDRDRQGHSPLPPPHPSGPSKTGQGSALPAYLDLPCPHPCHVFLPSPLPFYPTLPQAFYPTPTPPDVLPFCVPCHADREQEAGKQKHGWMVDSGRQDG